MSLLGRNMKNIFLSIGCLFVLQGCKSSPKIDDPNMKVSLRDMNKEEIRKYSSKTLGRYCHLNRTEYEKLSEDMKWLCKHEDEVLFLPNVVHVDLEAVQHFPKSSILCLGVTSIEPRIVQELGSYNILHLDELTEIDAETAQHLSRFSGYELYLDKLTQLNADVAKRLASFQGSTLSLNGVTSLDEKTAKELV